MKKEKFIFLIFVFFVSSNFFVPKIFALDNLPKDIFIAATVEPWIYFEVSPINFNLQPDLVAVDGTLNIGESPEITIKIGTSNPSGWEVKIKGKNGGLKSEATDYLISTVTGYSPLVIGTEGYGCNATTTLPGVILNSIYNYYNTNIVGEITTTEKSFISRNQSNEFLEVAKMKIKAAASVKTPADPNYFDIIYFTANPRL